ncbi:single-stranded DNA-binding protein [Ruegeria lacuscaerulensis]|uniref:single-stranded DNA-binding protein n=1 Tax=Ruegeria lacuscaerulensis TaxID=55218 RepID=UPI00147A6FB5|nr:single-stranded DNA-binding protein [Ruegeria lacuscaerulensis]
MIGVNRVILAGNLGRNPEITETADGKKISKLSVATSERWNDRTTGVQKSRTQWHSVVVYREDLANTAESLTKGDKVYVCGKLQTRNWSDQAGQKHYKTEIVLDDHNSALFSFDQSPSDGHSKNSAPTMQIATKSISDDWDPTDPPF